MLPRVILWNPQLAYTFVFSEGSGLQCVTCGKLCQTAYWNDGSSMHKQPRLIHDIEDFVLLVSVVYECQEGHRTLAHDQRVLNKLPCKAMVPFVLIDKSGFTANFVNFCGSLCQTGMNFHSLEAVIGHRRWEYFASSKQYTCVHYSFVLVTSKIIFHPYMTVIKRMFPVMMSFVNVSFQSSLKKSMHTYVKYNLFIQEKL